MILPPLDQIKREVVILGQYDLDDDLLFHACSMAGIDVFDLRHAHEPMKLYSARAHAMLLLALCGWDRHKAMEAGQKSHDFTRILATAWAAHSGANAPLFESLAEYRSKGRFATRKYDTSPTLCSGDRWLSTTLRLTAGANDGPISSTPFEKASPDFSMESAA